MKYNDIVNHYLTFTTPSGKHGKVISVEKDGTIAPVWRERVERWVWIVTARIEGNLVNLRFGTDNLLKQVKYNHEPHSMWRSKL